MRFKQFAASAMAALMLCASCVMPVSAEENVVSGDVDCSGTVNIADAVMLARFCAEDAESGITAQGKLNADLNGDGDVTAADTTALLDLLAGITVTEPAPFRAVNLLDTLSEHDSPSIVFLDDNFTKVHNGFAATLLEACAEEQPGKNIMISPMSVSLALGMTANGAKGKTLDEFDSVFGYSQMMPVADLEEGAVLSDETPLDVFNEYCAGWLTTQDEDILRTANSVWFRDDESMIHVPEAFLQTLEAYYQAEAYSAPFDDTTVSDINSWVNEKTDGMIPEIIRQLSPQSAMLLINALCFEADWATQYKDYQVRDEDFTCADGSTVTAQMMYDDEYEYLHDANAQGFVKRYIGPYSFIGVLPNEGVTLADYIDQLAGGGLQNLLDSREYGMVRAGLPKFEFDYSASLKEILPALGMSGAFTEGQADFTGLNDAPGVDTWISDVLHKTYISLDESGTRAAAVTAVVMDVNAAAPQEMKEVILNRPFLFMIYDETNHVPVFIGTVNTIED